VTSPAEEPASPHSRLRAFLFPRLTHAYLLRVAAVAVASYLLFGHLCIPLKIDGQSMEPAYRDGSWTFCWRPAYAFRDPEHHDVVAVRLSGRRIVLLKRVVATEGETVSFVDGILFVNGRPVEEPYVRTPCDWNLAPRIVQTGNVYVVGDNRGMAMEAHDFGQVTRERVVGAPLW